METSHREALETLVNESKAKRDKLEVEYNRILELYREAKEDYIAYSQALERYVKMNPRHLTMSAGKGNYETVGNDVEMRVEKVTATKTDMVRKLVLEMNEPLTVGEIFNLLPEGEFKRRDLYRVTNKLVEQGEIRRDETTSKYEALPKLEQRRSEFVKVKNDI